MYKYKYQKYKIKYNKLKGGSKYLILSNDISMDNIKFSLNFPTSKIDTLIQKFTDTNIALIKETNLYNSTVFYIWCLKNDNTEEYNVFKDEINTSIASTVTEDENVSFYLGGVSSNPNNLDICVYFECIRNPTTHIMQNPSVKDIVKKRENYRYNTNKNWIENSQKCFFNNIDDIIKLLQFIHRHKYTSENITSISLFNGCFSIKLEPEDDTDSKICCEVIINTKKYYLIIMV
jgi:hypothetical protein